jgi:hypothetical protein
MDEGEILKLPCSKICQQASQFLAHFIDFDVLRFIFFREFRRNPVSGEQEK